MAAQMVAPWVPTAEMPLMKGIRAKLVQALDQDKSLFEVTLMMSDVVKDLEKVRVSSGFAINATVACFEEGAPMMQMASLLHYVNVKLLRSIIAGTLAYDLYQDADLGTKCQYSDSKSPGTYVVSLSILGRQGKFLNTRELSSLANSVDKYAESARLWVKNKGSWNDQDRAHVDAKKFIKDVDSQLGRADPDGEPRFGPSNGAIEKLSELAKMFRRRVNLSLDIPNQGRTHQIQAPVMVGCTGETIAKRTEAHEPQWSDVNPLQPASGSLQSTTKTWALTLSLLQRMSLKPVVVHVAALPFFNPGDLPLTEILLTTLAQSLVWQDGFNVIQGGGKKDEHHRDRGYEEQKNVCYSREFLKTNLAATLQRIQEVRNKIAIIENLGKVDLDALETEINKLKTKENELQLAVNELEKTEAEFMERHNELKEVSEQQDEALKQWQAWLALLECIENSLTEE